MLLWLLHHWAPLIERFEPQSVAASRVFITARSALAALTAFLIAILLGPSAISWLKSRFRERIASGSEKLDELHSVKQSTPTMGGLFILAAVVFTLVLWGDWSNPFLPVGLFVAVIFAAIGSADDWVKLSTAKKGMSARQKFAWQIAAAVVAAVWLYYVQAARPVGLHAFIPWGRVSWSIGVLLVPWAVIVLVSSSNAVNLTDGLDGLAAGCLACAGTAFVALSYLAGHRVFADYLEIPYIAGCGECAVLMSAVVGAVLGFLWFNGYPAAVFMGDTGSLPLGALIGFTALASRQEVLLVPIGGVFVAETLSVIFQVASFRITGRRILECSPLHNHFVFRGTHEVKIVTRFWIIAALLAIASLTTLVVR